MPAKLPIACLRAFLSAAYPGRPIGVESAPAGRDPAAGRAYLAGMTDTLADATAAPAAEREPGEDAAATRLYLVDGSGYIFRAYHALPPLTRKSDGLPTGAVAGFCNMLWKLMEDLKDGDRPTHLAVIFDAGSQTFRNDFYPEYKANRPPPPEDLVPQF